MPSTQRRSREVRLGLVMYGGVSLAVYENGVAQELFRAVKGEGVYGLIKQLIDSDIVVDIVSGTSAGGINGIMLAYALANDRNFADSADLWREDGDLLRLLRPANQISPASVLDSEGYYQPRLEAAFRDMGPYTKQAPLASEVPEIDLFVTGTDVEGDVYTDFDDQGHPIDVKDHRGVFVLSHRAGRKLEFGLGKYPEARIRALAKLARVTSCFPVAFAPVQIKVNGRYDPADPDSILTRWGKLTRTASFLDGGVLDNKPFSYTIDAIFGRTADRDVSRMLFYVEPDPERFDPCAEAAPPPNVIQAAIKALTAIPGYESISSDLQDIAKRNSRLNRFSELAGCITSGRGVQTLHPSCLDTTTIETLTEMRADDPERMSIYLRSRFAKLRDRAVEGLLKQHGRRELLGSPGQRHVAKSLVDGFQKWEGDGLATLEQFDVFYRLRRAMRLVYTIKDLLYPGDEAAERVAQEQAPLYTELWNRLNHQIKVLEIIRHRMERLVDEADIFDAATEATELVIEDPVERDRHNLAFATQKWTLVQNCLKRMMDSNQVSLPDVLAAPIPPADTEAQRRAERDARNRFADDLHAHVSNILADINAVPDPAAGNLLLQCDAIERDLLRSFHAVLPTPSLLAEYSDFMNLDSYLFPLELTSGLEAKDVIHTVRISPIDAQRGFSRRNLSEKLCGDSLGHFSGFLKRSWRSNDIMWGRIDTLCQLVECTLTKERLEKVWLQKGSAEIEADVAAMFPNATAEQRASIEASIANVHGLNRAEFERFLDQLVEAAQREILFEDIPKVIADAAAQQVEWNQYREPVVNSEGDLPFVTGKQWIDPLLAKEIARQVASQGNAAQYIATTSAFNAYRVGSESARDVPMPVLLEIVSTSALVLLNAILSTLGEHEKRIRKSPLFKFGLQWPLQFFHGFTRFQRRAPDLSRVGATAIAAIAFVVLVIGVWKRELLVLTNSGVNWAMFAIFIAAPLAVLFAIGKLFAIQQYRRPGMKVRWLTLARTGLVGVAAFAVVFWLGMMVALLAGWTSPQVVTALPVVRSIPFLQSSLTYQPAFLNGLFSAAAVSMVALWMSRRSKLPAQPTTGEFELVIVDYLPSKDIRRLAARAGITVEGSGPLIGEARATLAKKIVAAMPVADLAYEIRQIRPGVLP